MFEKLTKLEDRLLGFFGRYRAEIEFRGVKPVNPKIEPVEVWRNWKPEDLESQLIRNGYIPADQTAYKILLGLDGIGRDFMEEETNVGEIFDELRKNHPYMKFIPRIIISKKIYH